MRLVFLGSLALALATFGAAPAAADWKSWLHGDPPPFVKSPPPKQLAAVSTAAGVTPDPQVEGFMRALAAAIMARDAAPVVSRLSERYTIEDLPEGANAAQLMGQAIGKIAGPSHIVIVSVAKAGNARIAKAEFRYDGAESSVKTFRFDARGDLLACDLFRIRVEHGA